MTTTVIKRNVEQFQILDHKMERDEAMDLYNELGKALGMPQIKFSGCDDRYSHPPHMRGSRATGFLYCSGRSQDAT